MTMDMNVQQRALRVEQPSPEQSPPPSSTATPDTPSYSPSLPTTPAVRPVKRSFDVAFLMAPDDNMARRHDKERQLRLVTTAALMSPRPPEPSHDHHLLSNLVDCSRSNFLLGSSSQRMPTAKMTLFEQSASGLLVPRSNYHQEDLIERVNKVHNLNKCSELNIINFRTSYQDDLLQRPSKQQHKSHDMDPAIIRSAFTKVTTSGTKFDPGALLSMPVPTSPSSVSSLSPDHVTYQGSMSPPTSSPVPSSYLPTSSKAFPMLSPQSHNPGGKALPPPYSSTALFLQQDQSRHMKPSNGLCSNGGPSSNDVENYLLKTANPHHLYGNPGEKELLSAFPSSSGAKLRPTGMLYPHADSVAAYSTLAAAYPFSNFSTELLVTRAPPPSLLATNPAAAAAAVVSASLLPPSFAALTLPAQNVCAKCNISFRMTSDLVYHMRSHHKGDSQTMMGDVRRRRDQDKLKCPVCAESFRERHHLTRHMTAHQDKEGDNVDERDEEQSARRKGASTMVGGK